MPKSYRNKSSTFKTPRRPYEKERIDQELELCGKYGLKNKREVWRVQLTLARLRKRARELLTLEQNDERRIFEGKALLNKMFKYGLLDSENEAELDFVLGLTLKQLLNRRLQSLVLKEKLSKSIHNARTDIRHGHIAVNKQKVNVPSFMVTVENESRIELHQTSAINGYKLGRRAKKNKKN